MRREIKSREHAYIIAEDKLYSDEVELGRRENEFYEAFGPDWSDDVTQTSSTSISSPASENLDTTDQHPSPRATNPLYDYEGKISLAGYLHGKIDQLIHDREEILEEQRRRGATNEKLDQDDLEFLETYEETYASRVKEFNELEEEIS